MASDDKRKRTERERAKGELEDNWGKGGESRRRIRASDNVGEVEAKIEVSERRKCEEGGERGGGQGKG